MLALLLLAVVGNAAADLRDTLSPFVGSAELSGEVQDHASDPDHAPVAVPPEPPVIAFGEMRLELFSPRLLAEFYADREYRRAWDVRRARSMLERARKSREDGFLPADFHADAIAAILDSGELRSADPARRDTAELLLADALLRYVHHFRFGKHNPERVNRGWTFVKPADAELLKADMAQALSAADMAAELAARLPSPDFYRNLKKGFRRYLAVADRGGWQDIPGGRNLSVGVRDPRVPLVREHLAVVDGYEPGLVAEPEVYDADLAAAVKGFQRRSGLGADGVVGPNTLRALNQPLDERLLAMRANLERMRWLYNDLPPDYLFVDLTAFDLYLVRGNEEVWRTKGIIGTVEDQTPMFRDEMEYLVFNPTWTVPRSIEKKFKGVPAGYKRVRSGGQYYLVQQPGPRNALGRVKFMFPNGHAIYLHDTPSRYLFNRSRRAYSHGCIRVHQPLTLAQQVLNEPAWSEAAINRVVRRGKTRWVHLDEHLPVLLYYLTAKADDQGRVGFRRDIYNRDRRLIAALDEPVDGAQRIAFAEPEPEPVPDDPDAAPQDTPADGADAAVAATDTDVGTDDAADGTEVAATETAPADDDADTADGATEAPAPSAVAATESDVDAAAEPGQATGEDVAGAAADPSTGVPGSTERQATPQAATVQAAESESPAIEPAPEPAAEPERSGDTADAGDRRPAARGPVSADDEGPAPGAGDIGGEGGVASQPAVLQLGAEGRFIGRSGGPTGALQRARLDLSVPTVPRNLIVPAGRAGGWVGRSEPGADALGDAPSIADEPPPVWMLPRD
jgi:murein L,D-transpeptidase YcbB/YkuD